MSGEAQTIRVEWTPRPQVDDDTMEWLCTHLDEEQLLTRFLRLMATELAANDHKGNRPGWLKMSSRDAVAELLYHAAKLSYAVRQFEQGDGPIEDVCEFAADCGNCALMVLDCTAHHAQQSSPSPETPGGNRV